MRKLAWNIAALALLIAGYANIGLAEEEQTQVEIMTLSPIRETTCVAVEVATSDEQSVSGLSWYNNDDQTVFPKVLAAAASPGMPPNLADALVIVDNVGGQEDGWSQLQFPQAVASPTGRFYVIFQFPAFAETEGRGTGPGIGYQNAKADGAVYLSGDGVEWLKMISAQRLLVEPIYAAGAEKGYGAVMMLPAPNDGKSEERAGEEIEVTALLRSFPNPFNPTVRFEFTLTESGPVRLSIYDVRGHLVRDIVNETLPKGRFERSWQGEDQNGRRQSSGVYFAKMEANGRNWTHRLVMVK